MPNDSQEDDCRAGLLFLFNCLCARIAYKHVLSVFKLLISEDKDMPRKRNPELRDEDGKLISRQYRNNPNIKESIKSYEAKNPVDKIIVRVPAGSREYINDYVKRKAAEEPENPKYKDQVKGKASVNAMIKALIEQEIGCSLDSLSNLGEIEVDE